MNNKTLIQLSITVTILVFVILVIKYGSGAIRRMFGANRMVFDYQDTPLIPGDPLSPDFDPMSYVVRLHEVLTTWMLDAPSRCDVYKRLMTLTDNEFITVINEYYHYTGRTLRSDMDATWQNGCSIFGRQWDDRVYDRMDELGVYA